MTFLKVLLISIPFVNGLPSLLEGTSGYLIKEYVNAITAYGPGLGVFAPYRYVDVSYDNIPFVGKIPVFGKEGTSSRLGISPFYPEQGNPSNPFPPLYRARPLPLHVPEPQDVVAVPLDEEALHGEPLFPPELVLPGEQQSVSEAEEVRKPPTNPFAGSGEIKDSFVSWPRNEEKGGSQQEVSDIVIDDVKEKNVAGRVQENIVADRKPALNGSLLRAKRIFL